ncbi:MAG: hypothetical protein PHP95_10685 [Desulfuromonadaceae bacterium]|nr:hypothetical protein [Desulfuromonadaceae bacterium]MDD2848912.1 hypothetical protein [Desulfuromonadaceae bacterium]MDD4132131.1 hypothetical protein [Desulfuromonadaceae bacterium]
MGPDKLCGAATLIGIDGYQDYPVPRIGMNSSGNSFTVWGIDSM